MNDEMNNSELITNTIDTYVNLQRIKAVNTCDNSELDYQIKVTEAKLSALGVNVKDYNYITVLIKMQIIL